MKKNNTVFVGLSGGVDSSVSALRLKQRGFNVIGVFIKVWHPDFLHCNWEQERLDAMRVCAKLDIPFLMCDAETDYKQHVADYFIEEYLAGRTPNADVMCNKYVKFGSFLDFAQRRGATYIATGHYAVNVKREDGVHELHRGADASKDQSYFLWTLTQEQLSHTLFPVGDSQKEDIRKEAQQAGLLTALKPDSQGICFLGHVDIPEFLSHYTDLHPGNVLDESGEVIGTHKGALVYTIGQRHGFTVHAHDTQRSAHYVIDRDLSHNTITVSEKLPITHAQTLHLSAYNNIGHPLLIGQKISFQTRYRQKPEAATVIAQSDSALTITAEGTTQSCAPGQSCVLYEGSRCAGGGIIT